MDYILKLLRSKSPVLAALGVVLALAALSWASLNIAHSANNYMAQYETKEEHRVDLESRETSFRKDVRIALLENNKSLLDEIEKRMRK